MITAPCLVENFISGAVEARAEQGDHWDGSLREEGDGRA